MIFSWNTSVRKGRSSASISERKKIRDSTSIWENKGWGSESIGVWIWRTSLFPTSDGRWISNSSEHHHVNGCSWKLQPWNSLSVSSLVSHEAPREMILLFSQRVESREIHFLTSSHLYQNIWLSFFLFILKVRKVGCTLVTSWISVFFFPARYFLLLINA